MCFLVLPHIHPHLIPLALLSLRSVTDSLADHLTPKRSFQLLASERYLEQAMLLKHVMCAVDLKQIRYTESSRLVVDLRH
jgi:hypothetical protein